MAAYDIDIPSWLRVLLKFFTHLKRNLDDCRVLKKHPGGTGEMCAFEDKEAIFCFLLLRFLSYDMIVAVYNGPAWWYNMKNILANVKPRL